MRSSNKSSMFKIGLMSAMLMSDTKPIHFERKKRKKTKTPLTNKQKLVRKKNKSARKSRAKNRR